MISDLPKYKSKFKAKGYICEKGLREDSEFTKLDQLLVQSICNPKRSLLGMQQLGIPPVALAWGYQHILNKSAVDKMVDKIEHIDTVFVSGNV